MLTTSSMGVSWAKADNTPRVPAKTDTTTAIKPPNAEPKIVKLNFVS